MADSLGPDGPPALRTTIAQTRDEVRRARMAGRTIGLVPTMGSLHEGHAELIRACCREADEVVVSVFVNPTQFGPTEDYQAYPRDLDADRRLCREAGASWIFAPTVEEMYPTGPIATFVEVPGITDTLEGPRRPGHFRGVATVVMKLFQIVQPDLAHFGQKDYQQLRVIQRMVADLNLPVAIRPVPTVRDHDGLALSSRNRYLDAEQRQAALVLSRALNRAVEAVRRGERSADRVRQILRTTIESSALVQLDYAEVADAETLERLDEIHPGRRAVALLAARVGKARLIDNTVLPGPES